MSDELVDFRSDVRAWLEANCPASMRVMLTPPHEEVWGGSKQLYANPDSRLWLERMAARGWTAPRIPKAYGGGGLSAAEAKVLAEEMDALGARTPLLSVALAMLAPTLLEFASEAQKLEHIPPMVRGEKRWCQGYSEPGAGSDLASLQMRAELDGDAYVVNGQKIWTSGADKSDGIFCLVRTDNSGPKHSGISFLLIDMHSPGIRARPIQLLSGASPFCETFFDNVRVPKRNLIGEPHRGWPIAKRLLQYERGAISGGRNLQLPSDEPLDALAKRTLGVHEGKLADALLRDRITQIDMDEYCKVLTLRRSAEAIQAGLGAGSETSMFKLYMTELNKRRKELRVELLGFRGIGWEGEPFAASELSATRDFLRSRASSIEGGTSEIQLNIIAKQVLGLPD